MTTRNDVVVPTKESLDTQMDGTSESVSEVKLGVFPRTLFMFRYAITKPLKARWIHGTSEVGLTPMSGNSRTLK